MMSTDILDRLMTQLHLRAEELPEGSYTTKLIQGGLSKMGGKLAEEVFELVDSAREEGPAGRDHLVKEACDVLYHLWVILATRQITVEQLRAELERREGVSGIVEKQNRQKEQQGQ
ncbi:MAG: phosphoribosyl-ATP diphosphatase [Planctomycetota bacterium]|jgi:phosphoribosyl-ATP pyrophosphohydrolase|nr:MAG: phosphoribosyl-ATP diphosphatase [Planctomycetota bacterium]RLS97466.1 MAG: phosphoribosyl-ATP diphosphatase [Planctomycetota bacterium]